MTGRTGMAESRHTSEYSCPGGVVPDRPHWRTILTTWRGFARTTNDHFDEVFEAYLELQARANSRMFDQVRAHPNGRKLFRDKPDLLHVLRDDEHLATFPPGTVGHAYRTFLTTNRLDAGVFDDASVIRPIAEKRNWHEDFYYFMRRYVISHDLYHVVTGYGQDIGGEITIIGFHCGQAEPAGPMEKFGYVMAAGVPGAPARHRFRVYRQAVERGRRADKLAAAPWEQMLGLPLDRARSLLGIRPTNIAHPQGLWFTTWTASGANPPQRWDYDAAVGTSAAPALD